MKKNFVKGILVLVICILVTLLSVQVFALEAIATTKYIVKDNVIMRIKEGTTVEEFLKNVEINSGAEKGVYKNSIKLSNKDLLGTGMNLKVGTDTTYNIVVRGDLNGDTKLSVTDLSLAKAHFVKILLLEGAYEKAFDVNYDNKTTITDLSLLRSILVGLEVSDSEIPEISGDIVISPDTTEQVKELGINVYWPDESSIAGLAKQISLDNGKTYHNYIGKEILKENNTVIARLVDQNSTIVKSASLVVNNIDNVAPEAFDMSVEHKISNYTTLKGETKDDNSGIGGYYFSYDNGTTWLPLSGLINGNYTFTDVPANTTIYLKMKATDKVGNETTTDTTEQRTFKKGIDILAEKLDSVKVNKETQMIILPDGRVFRLAITENGSYSIMSLKNEIYAEEQLAEEKMLNEKIAKYEENGLISDEEVLTKLTEEGLGTGTIEDNKFTTEKAEIFTQYRLTTNVHNRHQLVFLQTITKNGLTSSGQIAENEILLALEDLIAEMVAANPDVKILDILDRAVQEGLLLEENINRNNGRFETEVGLTYEIVNNEGTYVVELIGFAEDVEDGYIAEQLLKVLEDGLKNQIIDWAIADGITTEEKTSRINGMYEANNGEYKKVIIEFEDGTYRTDTITKPEGAIIEYKLNPDFPTMTNKTILEVTAEGKVGISKIEVFTELGDLLLLETYTDNALTKTENVDITYNGTYLVRVTTSDGKISEKEILISNIASILPIRVTINPESARNTSAPGVQPNGTITGPISVTLKYSTAALLENIDKYQYKLENGDWQIAKQEQLIDNIITNTTIYARYFDGSKSVKQVEIVIDTVDNIKPNDFNYTTVVTSNSITVEATTEDTATDSRGVKARDGVEGISQYQYKINDGEWQANNVFENLTQDTPYEIFVKAIDHAGNEKLATNSGTDVRTEEVPNAQDVITFEYSDTNLTKENVIVNFKSSLGNDVYTIQYQAISDGSELNEEEWISANQFEAIGNCKIYVRLIDSIGQENEEKKYAIGEITNIDNVGPIQFTPKVISTTKDSIKIQASSVGDGEAKDAEATNMTASSGTVRYDYYIIDMSCKTVKYENQEEYTFTFDGLDSASIYAIYVVATDAVGNSTMSDIINVVTNAEVGKIGNSHTTMFGTKEDVAYDNPIIPEGFAPVNIGGAEWGNGSAKPTGWNNGLVITDEVDKDGNSVGNEFVWVPVDGTDVTYEKWLNKGIASTEVEDGDGPLVGTEVLTEEAQIKEYGGFYVARTEASKNGTTPMSKTGETPWVGNSYLNAKEKAENMYDSNVLQSGLITGTQWDTIMKWIANTTDGVLNSLEFGNFSKIKDNTGSKEEYKINNIYDLSGNVQEITNELYGEEVVVRGGSYDLEKTLEERYTYSQEYANSDLGFRTVLYILETDELLPTNPGALGMGNINQGPGNVTINAGDPSYLNPVIPVGFKAVNTADAKWYGLPTPRDWNKGLVIEDGDGNQFVWVPVDGNKIKYEKWYTIYAENTLEKADISGDDIPLALQELKVDEQAQIQKYGGFYIARYEAGNSEGTLASKAGVKTVSAVTYAEAKEYAEGMYANPYVKSGLLTGTAWDTTMKWMASVNGNNKVLNDKTSGNNPLTSFKLTGQYAEGPQTSTDIRSVYKTGTNVSKNKNSKMLLTTGLVEQFKINNIYDMAGNVWEYTYEYALNDAKEKEYVARGADYYRDYANSAKWGAAIRETVTKTVGEKRNEGGFRVMLYLVEGTATVGKYEDFNRTMTGGPSKYNNPIVPSGFAPVNKGGSWGNGKLSTIEWDKGLVIEDQAGNEFVWVPVDGKDVKYENWLQTGVSYKDTDGNEIPEVVGKDWNQKEITQIQKYGGFYIARYESTAVTTDTSVIAGSKPDSEAWTNLNYQTAKEKAESMITKDNVKTGLVTGTAWDTVMSWIANEKGQVAVSVNSASWGYYSNSTLKDSASAKNIYLLAGGNWEWTAEKVGDTAVYRGGVKTDRGDSSPAGYRGTKGVGALDKATTFRMMLFVTGDVVGSVTKPVTEAEPLYGTKFPKNVNAPELVEGMTPVKWNGVTWVTTTANDPDWYSYKDTSEDGANTSIWANAKTPDGSMWVWIPRYAYKIEYTNPAKPTAGGKIHIVFLNGTTNEPLEAIDEPIYRKVTLGVSTSKNYVVHPAFREDIGLGGWTDELTGIWVGKFETSGNSAETVASKPNVESFSFDSQGSKQFTYARNAKLGFTNKSSLNIDTHMGKNTEWGAVAYLGHSVYGVNGAKVAENTTFIAGKDYTINLNQSTTGNVYGVYDMAGGRMEYVAAYIGSWAPARFGNISTIVTAHLKYKQIYGSVYSYYGDAMNETRGWHGSEIYDPNSYHGFWGYNHGTPRPLYVRGAETGTGTGGNRTDTMFTTSVQCSNTNFNYSFRMIICQK